MLSKIVFFVLFSFVLCMDANWHSNFISSCHMDTRRDEKRVGFFRFFVFSGKTLLILFLRVRKPEKSPLRFQTPPAVFSWGSVR